MDHPSLFQNFRSSFLCMFDRYNDSLQRDVWTFSRFKFRRFGFDYEIRSTNITNTFICQCFYSKPHPDKKFSSDKFYFLVCTVVLQRKTSFPWQAVLCKKNHSNFLTWKITVFLLFVCAKSVKNFLVYTVLQLTKRLVMEDLLK